VFLVKYRPDLSSPRLRAISAAEAGARLYLTALNALSHPNRGLDAVVAIAEHVPCFAIDSGDLPATCALIRSAMEQVIIQGMQEPGSLKRPVADDWPAQQRDSA
jgi:hypothetical protein